MSEKNKPQQESDERMEKLKTEIEKLLDAEQVTLVPRLQITDRGIMPVLTFESTKPEDIEVVKNTVEL